MNFQKFDHPADKRLITGVSGTGKTTFFQQLVKKEIAARNFIFDHQGEFSSRFGVRPIFTVGALCEKTALGGYICFDPVREFPGRTKDGFLFFCDYVLEVSASLRGRKLFICDELQKLTATTKEPVELLAILETGRRFQIDCIFIAQAPNRIHNAVRNQLTHVYTFRQSDSNALAYLKENGFDENAVRNLPRGRYLWRNLDTGETGEGGKAF